MKHRISILVLFISFLAGALAPAFSAIQKGPYLIYPGHPSQMEIHWQLDASDSCTIRWGKDASCADGSATVSEYNGSHQYKYALSNLKPEVLYYYRLEAGPAVGEGSFHAAPADDAKDVKFFAFGDTRTDTMTLNSVAGAMAVEFGATPDRQTFALHVGDWVSDGNNEAYWTKEFFSRDAPHTMQFMADLPIQSCIGNHEGLGILYQKYWPYPYANKRYWSFDYGPAHITVVDQYDIAGGPSDAQVDWIRNDLSSTNKQWKFLLYHEPAWSAGGHTNNLRAQQVLQPLCETYGVSICFAGHNHYYARNDVNGVQHITVGGGGAPLYDPKLDAENLVVGAKAYHYSKINIRGDRLSFTVCQPDGAVIDAFAISHAITKANYPLSSEEPAILVK